MVGCPTSVAYTTVKSGLLGYTLSAAYDYGPQNVRVNALCPGPIQTRISPKPGQPAYDWQCAQTVLGRVGTPREVALRRAVPRVGRSVVHHRRRHPGRRRLDLQVASSPSLARRGSSVCNCSSPISAAGANDAPLA